MVLVSKSTFLMLYHCEGGMYLMSRDHQNYSNFARIKILQHHCDSSISYSTQHVKPWPVSTSVCLSKHLKSDKLGAQSWTTFNPQEHLWTGYILVCNRGSLFRFSDKLKRNFSSGKNFLVNFLSKVYKLVLLKKMIHIFPHCSEKGLNETHSKK